MEKIEIFKSNINTMELTLKDIKNKVNQFEYSLNKMKKDLDKFIAEEKDHKNYYLMLNTTEDEHILSIGFYCVNEFYELGYITHDGHCKFLNSKYKQDNWEIWKEEGFLVAEDQKIKWKGIYWCIKSLDYHNDVILIAGSDSEESAIYNFKHKKTYGNVTKDNNFLKKDSDNRIHLF